MPSQGVNSVEDGALVNPPVTVTLSAPTQSGYTFGGYYSGQNGTGTQYYTNTMSSARTWNIATNNTTLYGKFTPITYTITYNLNGGTNNGSNPSTYTVESSTITFAAPTRTGYTFGGWYSNSALTTSKSQITSGSTGNVEVWAKWTIESYSIVTVENGGTTVDNFTGNYGDSITAPADPTRTGYTFEGWFSNIALTTAFTFPSTFPDYGADGTTVNVYAKWTAITYEVAYNGNTNTGGSMTNSTHTYDVAKQLTANAFTKTNYSFQGWATSSGGAVVYSNQQSVTNLRSSSGTYNLYAK